MREQQLSINFEQDTHPQIQPKTFMDFCAGIGGGRQAAEINGLKCVGFCEIDKDAELTYRSFYQTNEQNFGDIMSLSTCQLPDFDLMLAGFPCQAFSINGKRGGFEDDRGLIIYGLIKILQEKSIPFFVLENVKGLINHAQGTTLKIILHLLEESGYQVWNQVLNSSHFGSPQIRERVYIVGAKKELNFHYQFPTPNNNKINLDDFLEYSQEFIPNETFFKYLENKYNQKKYSLDDILKMENIFVDTRQSDIRFFEYCPTLRANRQGILYVKNNKIFKLSPSDCLRLQGFSQQQAQIAKQLKAGAIYKQAGNAMNVNTMSAIIKGLL